MGNLIFETNDKELGYDGKYKGKDCPEGVYFHTVHVTSANGSVPVKNGNVTLVL
jgi:large repetitive protein